MDFFTALIYIILFILLMVFVFSMGLSTPLIAKKGLISVIVIGFIAGLVGGGFFISPIYDDLPYIAGSIQELITGDKEIMNVEISTQMNITNVMKELKEKDGILSVTSEGIILKTDEFSQERKEIIESKIGDLDENFKSWEVNTEGEIILKIDPGLNPNEAISILSEWLMFTGGINTKYSVAILQLNIEAAKVVEIESYLNSRDIVVSSIEGPVQDIIEYTENSMPSNVILIFLCGLLGILVAVIGAYFDEIYKFFKKLIRNIENYKR